MVFHIDEHRFARPLLFLSNIKQLKLYLAYQDII